MGTVNVEELKAKFDDVVTDEHGSWSHVCETHEIALDIPESMLDDAADEDSHCGVIDCMNTDCKYVNF